MSIFNSKLLVYQRVYHRVGLWIPCGPAPFFQLLRSIHHDPSMISVHPVTHWQPYPTDPTVTLAQDIHKSRGTSSLYRVDLMRIWGDFLVPGDAGWSKTQRKIPYFARSNHGESQLMAWYAMTPVITSGQPLVMHCGNRKSPCTAIKSFACPRICFSQSDIPYDPYGWPKWPKCSKLSAIIRQPENQQNMSKTH